MTTLDLIEFTEERFQERLTDAQLLKIRVTADLAEALGRAKSREQAAQLLEEQRKEQEAERKRLEKERAELEAAKKAEREREEKRLAEERKKLGREKAAARAEAERVAEAKRQAEREAQEKAEAERKAEEERAAEARRLALAPDHEKLLKLATDLEEFPLPQVASDEAAAVLDDLVENMKRAISILRHDAEGLK